MSEIVDYGGKITGYSTTEARLKNQNKARARNKKYSRIFRLRKMGVTEDDLKEAVVSQGGLCAICQSAKIHLEGGLQVHVDHCHKTMKFRGILCRKCNNGLGMFNDDPARLRRAARYLKAGK